MIRAEMPGNAYNSGMDAQSNPYQSPAPIDENGDAAPVGVGWGNALGGWAFWSACIITGIGVFSYFAPNSPPIGFLLVGGVLFWFSVVVSHRYRTRSVVGGLISLLIIFVMLLTLRAQAQAAAVQRARAQAAEARRAAEAEATKKLLERVLGEEDEVPKS